ncbi:MAG: glycosyltransferase, partial [Lysobacterales bacterium]
MKPLPKISVIVPSFNQGKYLGETLASILSQDYPRLEVVVIDGGSTDESLEVIERYSERLAYWHSRPDNGQAHAISMGAARCSGDLLGWLNSDDFYWKDCLWTVARAYLRHPDHGLFIGNGLRYREGLYHPFCARHVALNREALVEGLDYILQPATFFLREAWEAVGGLDERLHYTLDWDIIVRVAQRYPAVLVNEFLAASREYPETKTGSGGMPRAMEILDFARTYAAGEVTPGALFYFCETLLAASDHSAIAELKPRFLEIMRAVADGFRRSWGNEDGFPQTSDPQDITYLPFAEATNPRAPKANDGQNLPAISVVTPSYNQAQYLGQALDSLRSQSYPALEMIVIDGGSTDNSTNVIRGRQADLAYWVSESDRGPAHAINKGFERAKGEVLAWLNSDDLLAEGALLEVGKAFADDPELDMVYANALYINESNQLFLADHGHCKTGLYYGRMQTREMVPAYWKYIHAVPQPTVFFRRRLLDQ